MGARRFVLLHCIYVAMYDFKEEVVALFPRGDWSHSQRLMRSRRENLGEPFANQSTINSMAFVFALSFHLGP